MAASDTDGHPDPDAEGASDSRPDPLVGTIVNGKYCVKSAIARGGMGRIYYATQVPLERPVALKVVQADGANEPDSQFLKRFLQEASILAKLQHPNVVTLFDYGRIEGAHVEQYFIAMEFLAGETLMHRLKSRKRLPPAEALILAHQIVRGLREAHKRGVVHRDLKPSNIILVPEGDGNEIVKLVDFGIGKVLGRPGDSQDLTQDGVFVGTPRYMAPEQFEGFAYPASDLYALGTILFQALTGRLPFQGGSMSELMVAKLARPVPLIREIDPGLELPEGLEALVFHLLARKPEERPSMDELSQQLLACEEEVFGTPHSMRRGVPSSVPSWTGAQRAASVSYGEPLRVPPTIVASIPALMQQMTPRAMASTARPPAPGARGSSAPLVAVFVLVLIGASGFGAYWKLWRTRSAGAAAVSSSSLAATAPLASDTAASTQGDAAGASNEEIRSALSVAPNAAGLAQQRTLESPPEAGLKPIARAASTAPKPTASAASTGTGLDIRLKR